MDAREGEAGNGAAPAGDGPIDEATARAATDRILASETFAHADRLSRFLRFTVARTLAGRSAEIKEYVLGVEVFDRTDTFDPRTDSIVRVEARRLRAKLAEYYEGEGRSDAVLVRLRKGSYVPQFERRDAVRLNGASPATPTTVDAGPAPPAATTPGRRSRAASPVAVLAMLGVAAIGLAWWAATAWRAPAPTTIAVLPLVNLSGDATQEALADRLTDGLIGELARRPELAVRSRTSVMQYKGARGSLRDITRALDVAVVVEASVVRDGDRVTVEARLVRSNVDRKVWADDFVGSAGDVPALTRRVATAIAGAAGRGPR